MRLDGVSTVAVLAIASFAIDRVVTAVLFLLSFLQVVPDPALIESPPARIAAEKRYKAIYYFSSAALIVIFLWLYRDVGVLSVLGLTPTPTPTATGAPAPVELPGRSLMDTFLTFVVLLGGADRLSAYMKSNGSSHAEKPAPQQLQVTGRLSLQEGAAKDRTDSR